VARPLRSPPGKGDNMNNIIYLIGLVVVVVAILGFFGLR
jgi:LPXTG-motif cell wall-anchored protein